MRLPSLLISAASLALITGCTMTESPAPDGAQTHSDTAESADAVATRPAPPGALCGGAHAA